MLEFSEDLRRNCPEARFDDVIRFYSDARAFLLPKVRPEDISLVASVPFKVAIILQVGLRRALHLTESTVRELNAGGFIPSFVLSRALLETACVVYDTEDRFENAMQSSDRSALAAFDEDAEAVLLGSRSEPWGHPEIVEFENIVNIVNRVDKAFDWSIKRVYDDLSEHVHPNFAGMAATFSQIDEANSETRFIDDPWKTRAELMTIPVAATALSLLLLRVSHTRHHHSSGALIRACEEEIYRRGTWPPTVPYPWGS